MKSKIKWLVKDLESEEKEMTKDIRFHSKRGEHLKAWDLCARLEALSYAVGRMKSELK